MKRGIILAFLLLLFSVCCIRSNAQSLVIKMKNGTESSEALEILQKFSFLDNNMLVEKSGGTNDLFTISEIQTIRFNNVPVGIDKNSISKNDQGIVLYPNPANQVIYLKNLPENGTQIQIYRIDGILIYNIAVESTEQSINIDNLNEGLYLLRVNNEVIKFKKL